MTLTGAGGEGEGASRFARRGTDNGRFGSGASGNSRKQEEGMRARPERIINYYAPRGEHGSRIRSRNIPVQFAKRSLSLDNRRYVVICAYLRARIITRYYYANRTDYIITGVESSRMNVIARYPFALPL